MQSLDEVARSAMGSSVFRVTRYGNTSRIPGKQIFPGLVATILKFDRMEREMHARASSNTIVSRQVSAKWRLFGIHKRISRIFRWGNVTNPTDLCVSRFVIRPLSALCGATGERYLVFRSWTTADVPQRSFVSRLLVPLLRLVVANCQTADRLKRNRSRRSGFHRYIRK